MNDVIRLSDQKKTGLIDVVVPWAGDEEELKLNISDGEWIVTEENELTYLTDDDYEYDIKDSFRIVSLADYHTTDWMRLYFHEHYPEIDFDEEFKTKEPGVFARVQDKIGHEYEEWVKTELYRRLKDELFRLGYGIVWPEK